MVGLPDLERSTFKVWPPIKRVGRPDIGRKSLRAVGENSPLVLNYVFNPFGRSGEPLSGEPETGDPREKPREYHREFGSRI